MKYAFIRRHRHRFRVRSMCRVLAVSRSGFYDWLTRPASARSQDNRRLTEVIRRLHIANREAFGAEKTWRALKAQGYCCGRHRVARLRREAGIMARRRRRFCVQRACTQRIHIVPNELNQVFDRGPTINRVWVGDATFIATRAGWLYLAILIDLYSRKVVGWCMDRRHTAIWSWVL